MKKGLIVPKRASGALTPSHARARNQEKDLAVRLRGRTTPASGALDMKGDVRVARVVRIECKTTTNKSFSITREMVRKIEEAALGAGELPAMVIEFIDAKGKPQCSVAVVPVWALDSLAGNANFAQT